MAKGTTAYERIARRQARAARRSEVSQVKASEELSFNELIERMAASSRTFSSISVNPSNAMRCTTVQGIVRAMTNAIGTYPARVVRAVDGEGGEVIETAPKHPVNMVLRRPNPIQTQAEFFRMVMQHTLLWGNFYALKGQGQTGPLQFLRPIEDPDAVSLDSLNWGRGAVFRVSTGTEPQKFVSGSQIFRATSGILGDDGVTGVSPVRLAAKAIAVCIAAEQLIGEMYVNNDMPTMALTGGEFRDREAYELWEQKFREARGAIGEGRGGTLLLPKGMEPKEMSFRPIDAQLLEMRKFQRIEIAQVYGVPPHKLADLERATFCLPAGTLVYTAVGPKPIEEIERGEAVWSYGDGEWRRRLVTRAGCTGEDEILKIRTGNRTLRANARHRVLARRKYAMPSAGRGKYQSVEWRTEYVPAGELKVGDTVVAFNGLHAYQSSDDEAPGGRGFDMRGCSLSRITAIERQPAEPVYDLEVEETHNFVADGIVVHNSNIEEQSLEFVRDTSRPAIMLLQQAARRDLLSPEDRRNGYEVLFDMEAATEGRLKDRLEAYGKAVEIGAMSPNEVRRRLGMNPRADDGGDEYMTPLNMRTTSDESQQSDTQDQAAGGEGAGMGAGRPRRPVRAV